MCEVLQHYRTERKFALHAFVIMPDHVHVLLTPHEDVALERAIQYIKGGFSLRLKSKLNVWEGGHFGRRLADRESFNACSQYIVENPVRKQIVHSANEYAFSSASREGETDMCPGWLM